MITRDKKVRISAKAIVIRKGRLLLMRAADRQGTYYLLPGGGQKNGETLHEAVVRECAEETGLLVQPGQPRYIRDYVARHHEFARWDASFHQVEIMFPCEFIKRIGAPHEPDARQTGISWVATSRLGKIRLYPSLLKILIAPDGRLRGPLYLGDSN
ncbi:MAG: NUDIX domain-containing protein [Elusimicrobiales bacterium]|nr:NUDIX domain-containing protein [Elusimicrobiales bacterium]